jgi:leucyl-tRNA synthetase
MQYDFNAIEAKWQQHWAEHQTFHVANPGPPEQDSGLDTSRPKFFCMDMFPYPSGVGLHVGHPLGFIATDIVARYKRAHGYNVLHPMGFDAFGLPAEQYAIETNVHPRMTTEKNIANMVTQLKRLGMAYDWDRSFATTDPGYMKWTQWIFLQLFHSYYDPLQNQALPIAHLVDKLEGEDYLLGPDGDLIWSGIDEDLEAIAGYSGNQFAARKWSSLDPDQQRRLLDEYRLAYLADVEVNWCPGLGTVLANEEVTNDGRSERGNLPVEKKPLKQWMLRITAYADRLIDDLDLVNWPEPVKLLQRNWIGKSTGAVVDFPLKPGPERSEDPDSAPDSLRVFTTRPDTLFGATYMVLAPEHELVDTITTPAQADAVQAYRAEAAAKSSIDRQASGGDKQKTGVFTGAYATNPVNDQPIPVWIADYVMTGYGTGAIMAVPAHDERDHAFATKFNLPIIQVVKPDAEQSEAPDHDIQTSAYTGPGTLTNSANDDISLDGKPVDHAKREITDWLQSKGLGKARVQYRLRDWLFSRQRYWGEPFPILHGPHGELRAVDEADLPVELPEMDDFQPRGTDDPDAASGGPSPPLGRAGDDWKKVTLDGIEYTRELNTMPNWAGSCWYYLRYLDPHNTEKLVDPAVERYWMGGGRGQGTKGPSGQAKASDPAHSAPQPLSPSTPVDGVDLYVGGVEHAVLHLLYARFWHKVLYDLGHVSTPEPFGRLFSQGYIQAYCYRDARGIPVPADQVVNQDGKPAADVQGTPNQQYYYNGQPVSEEFGKMGKSLKNAVAPDEVCDRYGCDTLRLYEMYLGPLDQSKIWNTHDIVGVHRFLNRLWRNLIDPDTGQLLVDPDDPPEDLARLTHKTIKRVTQAMESMGFNVAIAALIELNNALVPLPRVPRFTATALVQMLAPLAPHIAEELWERLGQYTETSGSVADAGWPLYSEAMLVEDTVEYPVQVNGKMRGRVTVPADAEDDRVIAAAQTDPNVASHLEGKTLRKAIVIKGRMVNLVVGSSDG